MGMLRSLQMVLHLPVFHVIVPGNVIDYFAKIIPLAMFDVFENGWGWGPELILDFDDESHEQMAEDILD